MGSVKYQSNPLFHLLCQKTEWNWNHGLGDYLVGMQQCDLLGHLVNHLMDVDQKRATLSVAHVHSCNQDEKIS